MTAAVRARCESACESARSPLGVVSLAVEPLRRHVRGGAALRHRQLGRATVELARDAKVRQLDEAAPRQHHVGWLEVAVDARAASRAVSI
eukprot:2420193-Prymnesium_polylepis.1